MSKDKEKDHSKELEREHQRQQKEEQKHDQQLKADASLRKQADRISDSIFKSGGGSASASRARICAQGLSDIGALKWQGLGRDVHDFLVARQHGWDRASSVTGGGGPADRVR